MATSVNPKLGPVDLLWGHKLRYENASLRKQFTELELSNTALHERVGRLEATITRRLDVIETNHITSWERVEGLITAIANRMGILETDHTGLKKELGDLTRRHLHLGEEIGQSVSRIENAESKNKTLGEQATCLKHSLNKIQDQTNQNLDHIVSALSELKEGLQEGLGGGTENQPSASAQGGMPKSPSHPLVHNTQSQPRQQIRRAAPPMREGEDSHNTASRNSQSARKPIGSRPATTQSGATSPPSSQSLPPTSTTKPQLKEQNPQAVMPTQGGGSHNLPPPKNQSTRATGPQGHRTARQAQSKKKRNRPPRIRSSRKRVAPNPPNLQAATMHEGEKVDRSPALRNLRKRKALNLPDPQAVPPAQEGAKVDYPPYVESLRRGRTSNPPDLQAAKMHEGERVGPSPALRNLRKRKTLNPSDPQAVTPAQEGTKADYPPYPESLRRGMTSNLPDPLAAAPVREGEKVVRPPQPKVLRRGVPTPRSHKKVELIEKKVPLLENSRKRKASKSPKRQGARLVLGELVYCPPQPRYPWPRRFLNSPEP
ncbi:MAG: hypothetical protein M1839_008001 [Geoglossum umbratile]|nr:MAG: hypothetical protein M1839_008001 [Geoglossum umbratile]